MIIPAAARGAHPAAGPAAFCAAPARVEDLPASPDKGTRAEPPRARLGRGPGQTCRRSHPLGPTPTVRKMREPGPSWPLCVGAILTTLLPTSDLTLVHERSGTGTGKAGDAAWKGSELHSARRGPGARRRSGNSRVPRTGTGQPRGGWGPSENTLPPSFVFPRGLGLEPGLVTQDSPEALVGRFGKGGTGENLGSGQFS